MAKVRRAVVHFATNVLDMTDIIGQREVKTDEQKLVEIVIHVPTNLGTVENHANDVLVEWMKETEKAAQLQRIQREFFAKHFDGVYSIDKLPVGYLGDNAKEAIAAYNRGREDERTGRLREKPVIKSVVIIESKPTPSLPETTVVKTATVQTPVKPIPTPLASSPQRPVSPIVQTPTPTPTSVPSSSPVIYSFPIAALIRWMGSQQWTREEALKVLKVKGYDIATGTIDIHLSAGRKASSDPTCGGRGPLPILTDEQVKDFRSIIGR